MLALTTHDILIGYVTPLLYLLAAVLFIFGLKLLGKVKTATRGNTVSAVGMLIATAATFFYISGHELISLVWIAVAILIGSGVGLFMATRVQMTAMPQMVALLNGFGGIASLLVACGDYSHQFFTHVNVNDHSLELAASVVDPAPDLWVEALSVQPWYALLATGLATLIGGVTFTGSVVAWAKLEGVKWMPDQPVQFPGQKIFIALLLLLGVVLSFVLIFDPPLWGAVVAIGVMALVLGVLLVIGIGGADMPVVISLLNSYSGLAAAMAGFVLNNDALIITGSLVGASGIILTNIMCKAMNRSLLNVLFGGMGATGKGPSGARGPDGAQGEAKSGSAEDAAIVLEAASSVMVIPGYGMAVAQAQHAVKELMYELEERGCAVTFAIHPVAGRMPGHMNVLLAEAGIDYDKLLDLDQSNAALPQTDVALVIGANDVTNPAARHDETSPLYGMPILNVDQARTVFVIKRSLNPGFAGIQNELYFTENTTMLFGDAKGMVTNLANELEAISA